jgi:hypothetical protein
MSSAEQLIAIEELILTSKTTKPMTTATLTNPSTHFSRSHKPSLRLELTNLSRGARRFAIRAGSVFIESGVLDDYAATDPALGYNVAGVILCALARRLPSGGLGEETLAVCLLRRDDALVVELHLQLQRTHRAGIECLVLRKSSEPNIDPELG